MARKHKWDEFLDFNDWQKDDDFQEEVNSEESKKTVENTEPREIQGIGISEGEEEFDLSAMIAGLNAENKEYTENFEKEESSAKEEKAREEAAKEAEEKAKDALETFEKEQAEKEAREFAKQEEEARRIAQELEKKQNNPLNKAMGILSGGKKKKKTVKGEDTAATQIEEAEEPSDTENLNTPPAEDTEITKKDTNTANPLLEGPEIQEEGSERVITSGKVTIVDRKNIKNGKKDKNRKKEKEIQTDPTASVIEDIVSEESAKEANIEESDIGKEPDTEETVKKESNSVSLESTAAADIPIQQAVITETLGKKGLFPFKKAKKGAALEEPDLEGEKEKKDPKEKKDKIDWEYVAMHDELTGLYNQRAYVKKKEERFTDPFAVVYIDVNNLKYTNDTIGHEAGNELITATAKLVDELFPDEGYRTGGDEFIVITEDISFKKADKILSDKHTKFHAAMEKLTKKAADTKLIYAASFGYAVSDGTKSFEETAKEAEESMYVEKAAYKKSHPEYDMRRSPQAPSEDKEKEKKLKPTDPDRYDDFLTDEQKELKKRIKAEHTRVSNQSTMEIVREIQSRASELVAVLIASPTFDHLFIIQTADTFINVVSESESVIDYSYLYIIYRDGPVYKGADEYLEEITDIFTAIGKGLISGKIREEKDILKISGINIFKNIYVD